MLRMLRVNACFVCEKLSGNLISISFGVLLVFNAGRSGGLKSGQIQDMKMNSFVSSSHYVTHCHSLGSYSHL